ncbi:MAG: zinc-ribbon domain-containing protein [Zoogloea sp.]|nr:zinc-ribbon domain-containing protein [Zoogloea sp.]
MILARCPACATTFRVRPEQLRARQGRVRCGHCQHAFNALETLVDEGTADEALALAPAPAQSEPALADSSPPLFVLEEKTQIEPFPPIEPSPDEPAAEPAQVSLPAPEPFEPPSFVLDDAPPPGPGESAEPDFEIPPPAEELPSDDPRIEPHGEVELAADWPAVEIKPEAPPPDAFALPDDEPIEAQAASPASDGSGHDIAFELPPATEPEPEPDTSLHIEAGPPFAPPFRPEWPDASELELKAEAAAPLDFDSLLHRQDTGDSTAAALPEAETASPAAAAPIAPPPGHEADAGCPPADTWQGSPAGDDTEPETEAEAADEKPSGMLRQAAWAAGATLLALVLLAQGVLVFRNQIVQSSPHMRPFMESLCATIGCDLPLPRDATLIAIESSDIQPDAGREAFFTLHVTLRNRAEFAQAHPHLEVTLTDARDKALVRRVLEPAQWLPADAPKDAFPAHREIAAQVAFEAPLVAAAGYRVWVFYP